MSKTVLNLLDASVNGVNRFISSNVPLDKPLAEYRDQAYPLQFVAEEQVLRAAEELVQRIMEDVPRPQASSAEQVIAGLLQIFTSPNVLLGAAETSAKTVEIVTAQVKALYRERKPLGFTLLGYPNKMPNPLYTISTGADLGEIVSLLKLSKIMERVAAIYPFGVTLHVLTENTIFYKMSGLNDKEQHDYFIDLTRWAKLVDPQGFLAVEDIVAYHSPELEQTWSQVTEELASKYRDNDPAVVDMVDSVMPTNFMTGYYRDLPREILLRFFDPSCTDEGIEALRRRNYEQALTHSFSYLAYHQARYRLGFMDKVFPNTLRLTVAPKAGSFGVGMLNASAKVLPYYGYIVKRGLEFTFSYLADIPLSATAVYQQGRLGHPMYFLA